MPADTDRHEMLVTLTADIVSAHVSNNDVDHSDVATLIENVFGALRSAGTGCGLEVA